MPEDLRRLLGVRGDEGIELRNGFEETVLASRGSNSRVSQLFMGIILKVLCPSGIVRRAGKHSAEVECFHTSEGVFSALSLECCSTPWESADSLEIWRVIVRYLGAFSRQFGYSRFP